MFSSKVTAGTVIDMMTKPELVNKAKEEHARRLAGKKYVSPIPSEVQPPLKLAEEYAEKNRGRD